MKQDMLSKASVMDHLRWVLAVFLSACRLFFEPLRSKPLDDSTESRSRHRHVRAGLLLTVILGGALGAGQFLLPPPFGERIVTAAGEWKSTWVEDGTLLHARPNTEMSVRYSADYRRIYLERGDVLAEVAHSPVQPFEIMTPEGTARAIGTQFSVTYSPKREMRVTVAEGTVNVIPTPSESASGVVPREQLVRAGEAAFLSGGRLTIAPAADPRLVHIDGRVLRVEGATIGELAAQLSVRGPLKFVVDSRVASFVIPSLKFTDYQPQELVERLASSPNIATDQRGDVVHLRSRPGPCPRWLRCDDSP